MVAVILGPAIAWGRRDEAAQMMIQHKEFKHQKAYAPFELYINNPKATSPAELITEVCYPSK